MLQLNLPATLLRALKGPPISIVIACLIEPTRHLAVPDLQSLTGYSPNSIRSGVKTLAEMGLLQGVDGRYYLTAKMHQMILPAGDTQIDTDTLQTDTHTAQKLSQPAQKLSPSAQKLRVEEYRSCKDSVREPSHLTPDSLPPPPAQNMRHSYDALTDAGVYPHVARELSADPWITPERIAAWSQDLEHQNRKHPGTIRSVAAVLCANLQAHREPPRRPPDPANDRRRFTSGPYAEFILS